MTVLAWDGKTLAADRQLTLGGTPIPSTKIHREDDHLVGLLGEVQEGLAFLEWYRGGCDPKEKPTMKQGFAAYVVIGKQLWKYESMLIPYLIDMPFWGAGSGGEFAIGAMAAGKTATEAVEIACQFDNCCGLGIDTLSLEG